MKNLFNFMLLGLMILASCTSDKTEEVAPLGTGPQTIQVTLPLGGTNTKGFETPIGDNTKPNVKNMTIYIANAQGLILKSMTATYNTASANLNKWDVIGGTLELGSDYVATISTVPATAAQVFVLANATYPALTGTSTLTDVKNANTSSVYKQQDKDNLIMTGISSGFTSKTVGADKVWAASVQIAPKVARFQIQAILKSTTDPNEALESFTIKEIYVNQYYESYNLLTDKEAGDLFPRWLDFPAVKAPELGGGTDLSDLAINKVPANWNTGSDPKCYAYHFFPATAIPANLPHIVIAIDNIKFTAASNMPALASTDVRYLVIKKYRITSTSGDLLTSFEKGKLYNLTIPVAAKNLNLDPNAPTVTIECTVTVKPWVSVNIVPDFTN